jgi:hypothetical protein
MVYVNYTSILQRDQRRIAAMPRHSDPNVADLGSEQIILNSPGSEPGGQLQFGLKMDLPC